MIAAGYVLVKVWSYVFLNLIQIKSIYASDEKLLCRVLRILHGANISSC